MFVRTQSYACTHAEAIDTSSHKNSRSHKKTCAHIYLDSAEVHRFFNNLKIVRDAKLDGIHWLCKHPSVLVVFEHLGYRLAIEVRFIKEVAAVVEEVQKGMEISNRSCSKEYEC